MLTLGQARGRSLILLPDELQRGFDLGFRMEKERHLIQFLKTFPSRFFMESLDGSQGLTFIDFKLGGWKAYDLSGEEYSNLRRDARLFPTGQMEWIWEKILREGGSASKPKICYFEIWIERFLMDFLDLIFRFFRNRYQKKPMHFSVF